MHTYIYLNIALKTTTFAPFDENCYYKKQNINVYSVNRKVLINVHFISHKLNVMNTQVEKNHYCFEEGWQGL